MTMAACVAQSEKESQVESMERVSERLFGKTISHFWKPQSRHHIYALVYVSFAILSMSLLSFYMDFLDPCGDFSYFSHFGAFTHAHRYAH